jgi:hypothetical protein
MSDSLQQVSSFTAQLSISINKSGSLLCVELPTPFVKRHRVITCAAAATAAAAVVVNDCT